MSSHDEHDDLGLNAVTSVGKSTPGDEVLPSQLQVLVIGNGTFATHTIHDAATVTIGRSSACDVAVNDESISRRHAILHIGATTVTIEDVGSVNGTQVRGTRIGPGKRVEIAAGELVGIGDASILLQRRARPVRSRRIWTHDYFEARLEDECAREERSGVAFTLLRLHPDRRAPARFVEETLGDSLRETDILGKYGPHEYEVLLPDTPPTKAVEAVGRIEARLKERRLDCRIFAACCPRDGRSPYQLIAKAQAPVTLGKAVGSPEIVVNDVRMKGLYQLVAKVAVSQIGVLLLGETGVGKEMFARAVHEASRRAGGPFVEINCAALTETLLESELFGHEKGAFTNAVTAKVGLLESAQGGTVLLDEIGDMPLATQVKLLRVIEDSQVRRVGGLKSKPIDVRFVAATNCDIEALVERGAFRRDLFFRLNGVTIVIPPLRERLAELELLATAFIKRATTANRTPEVELSSQAIEAMKRYHWPGNIRELKNVMERAVLLCGEGPILPEHLPSEKVRMTLVQAARGSAPSMPTPSRADGELSDPAPASAVEGWAPARPREKGSKEEQQWILQALERAGGNQTEAARQLGISRRTLVSRLNDYSVARPRKATRKPEE